MINWTQIITWIISGLALVISIITIITIRKNLKKQLRLEKLEEILEIIFYLNNHYSRLFDLFSDVREQISLKNTNGKIPFHLEKLDENINTFSKIVTMEILTQKMNRLRVLSNAYLPNSRNYRGVKEKIITMTYIYGDMYMYLFTKGVGYYQNPDVKIPKTGSMNTFLNSIMDKLIKEMGFGYKSVHYESLINYRNNHFYNEVETIKK